MASRRVSFVACDSAAFLRAVRSAERCARLRTAAARDFRMFFSADLIFGTAKLSGDCDGRECDFGGGNLGRTIADVKAPHGFDIISRPAYLARGLTRELRPLPPRRD